MVLWILPGLEVDASLTITHRSVVFIRGSKVLIGETVYLHLIARENSPFSLLMRFCHTQCRVDLQRSFRIQSVRIQ